MSYSLNRCFFFLLLVLTQVLFYLTLLTTSTDSTNSLNAVLELEKLRALILEEGGYFSPLIAFDPIDPSKRGVFWLDRGGEANLLRIPKKFTICEDDTARLIEEILTLKLNRSDTFFNAYFDFLLPQEPDRLLDWTKEEILTYLDDQFLLREFLEGENERAKNFLRFKQKRPIISNTEATYDQFKLVDFWVHSRVFRFSNMICFVPFFDYFRHDFSAGNKQTIWTLEPSGKAFNLQTFIPAQDNAEFFISYGDNLTNENLLLNYGFVEAENPNQADEFVYPSARYSFATSIVLSRQVFIFEITRFFRIQTERKRIVRESNLNEFLFPRSLEQDFEAYNECARSLEEHLPTEKVLQAELEFFYHAHLPQRQKQGLAYKLSYYRIFQIQKRFCERMIEFVRCHNLYGLKLFWFSKRRKASDKHFTKVMLYYWKNEYELTQDF